MKELQKLQIKLQKTQVSGVDAMHVLSVIKSTRNPVTLNNTLDLTQVGNIAYIHVFCIAFTHCSLQLFQPGTHSFIKSSLK